MEKEEIANYIVDICATVFKNLSDDDTKQGDLFIRVDMEQAHGKPVFSLFEGSRFIKQIPIKELIMAGGGRSFILFIKMQVNKIFKGIFEASMKRTEIKESKRFFVLLYENKADQLPYFGLFLDNKKLETVSVREMILTQNEIA